MELKTLMLFLFAAQTREDVSHVVEIIPRRGKDLESRKSGFKCSRPNLLMKGVIMQDHQVENEITPTPSFLNKRLSGTECVPLCLCIGVCACVLEWVETLGEEANQISHLSSQEAMHDPSPPALDVIAFTNPLQCVRSFNF